jgi:hypothetical protein
LIVDLRSLSVEEIVAFVFDHPAPDPEERAVDDAWYWQESIELKIEPRQAIAFLTDLFERSPELLSAYTDSQVDQGFWCLFSAFGKEYFSEALWNPDVPWPERQRCIAATVSCYESLFECRSIESSAWMFWDLLAYAYYLGHRDPARSAEDARVQDEMFRALRTLLLQSSRGATQHAALHGLGHLRHRATRGLIAEYLSAAPRDPALIEYAGHVQAGKSIL